MENEKNELKMRLCQVEEEICEAEKRIPAHSVKPPVMEDIFELEDEKETILKRLAQLNEK